MTRNSKISHTIILPIALLVMVSMAVVGSFIWFSAKSQDEIARADSIKSVAGALERHAIHLGRIAKDFAWWNEAVENLVVGLDLEWADQGIGFYAFENYGYKRSFVLDGQDRTIYGSIDSHRVNDEAFSVLHHGLGALVDQARAFAQTKPEPATGILKSANGRILLVGISAIAPEDGAAFELPDGPKHVLVFTKALDQDLLDQIGGALPLEGLRLAMGNVDSAGDASLPLLSPDGTRLGTLIWQPHKPGWEFLRSVLPSLIVAVATIAIFTWMVLQHVRQTARAIEASEARFRDVADATSDWIWETDAELRLSYLSERFATVTGISPGTVLGRSLCEVMHQADSTERWTRYLDDLQARRSFRNILCLCEDHAGQTRALRVAGKPIFDDAGLYLGFRGTATDITTELNAERRAQYLALHDPLTGLPNRELLNERLDQAVANVSRRQEVAAVLCLDLDHFKDVNDTLGHTAGDLLIRRCAERLEACVREIDTVARIGGDEFAIVQVGLAEPDDAQRLCRRLLETIDMPFDLDGHEVLVTASIGVALTPTDGSIPGRLLQNADIALYRAKEEGRNTFRFFEPDMDARLQKRKALERDLRRALLRDELELFYQPRVLLDRSRIAGVEALVRWHHPVEGLVPPTEFISVAEETGLIFSLGEWVLRTACRQARRWGGIRMSVNISPVQFKHRDLVAVVEEALKAAALDPDQLELEITEGVLLQNTETAICTLKQLKALGVHVSMDDFGTGYSSLSYLQKFPFDKIKIDKSFVSALRRDNDADAIVRAVIGLVHNLGMQACAEGVETSEQLEFLRREGCDEVQGFYFGRPMPTPEFERLREAWLNGETTATAGT
jgi:diguanylate cyclase (GGDEF)-like protein/PAS domain S-box-containing protein